MNSLIGSLQFITTLPLGKPRPFAPTGIIVCFPLVGLIIGLLLACADWFFCLLWPVPVAAVLDLILLAAITGALHLDGLADTADGLYGHREPQQALAIMKDSRVGAMGLVAVACLLLVKAAALAHLDHNRFLALVLVPAYARSSMIFGIRFLPYARTEGGTGSPFFETPLKAIHFGFIALPLAISVFLGWPALVLNITFVAATGILIAYYRHKLGGITGDLLGAMTEILEAVLLLAFCLGVFS